MSWKVIEGEVKDQHALDKVIKAIEDHLGGTAAPQKKSEEPRVISFGQPNQRKKKGGSFHTLGELTQ